MLKRTCRWNGTKYYQTMGSEIGYGEGASPAEVTHIQFLESDADGQMIVFIP